LVAKMTPLRFATLLVLMPTLLMANAKSIDPNDSETFLHGLQPATLMAQARSLELRQASCPSPSSAQTCPIGFCFLQQIDGAVTWGTCCPTGFSLILFGGEADTWSTQKCCPGGQSVDQCKKSGISETPERPLNCGDGGTISGWGCVISTQSASGGTRLTRLLPLPLYALFTSIWCGYWLSRVLSLERV
jgi:hypothetical protein